MFKPLLSGKAPEDLRLLKFPLIASPKLDGIRCVKLGGRALSRHLKPIPNDHVRTWIEANLPNGIDGELVLQDDWTAPFNKVTSAIMSKDGTPRFCFAAFDLLFQKLSMSLEQAADRPFEDRFESLRQHLAPHDHDGSSRYAMAAAVPHERVDSYDELVAVTIRHIEAGYEGTMVRDPRGRYKFGRSTLKEGILLKIKQFDDEEAEVLGVEEEMENCNEATVDALGRTERSTKKEGMRGKGRVGRLHCRFADGTEFHVGSGLTDEMKAKLWDEHTHPDKLSCLLRTVKIKHQPPPGGRKAGEAPRFPVFLGFRED